MIKIMLVDDHAIVREGFVRLINTNKELEVVAQANSGHEAYELLKKIDLDIVITDFSMPGISGLRFIENALTRKPDLKIIMCSMHDSLHIIKLAFKLGAKGFVSKSSAPQNILDAILAVNENNIFLSDNLQIPSEDEPKSLDELQLEELTTSEFETFKMLAKGLSIAEIARDMNLSEKTINNYQTQIRIKLQLQTPAQLVHFALRNGIIKPTLSVDP
jgi:two-component system, NarL family, invasion response regulator UvrY